MQYSNPELLEKKEELLNDAKVNFALNDESQSLAFDFHGIEIKLHSTNEQLLIDLAAYLPDQWLQQNQSNPLVIIHSSYPKLNIEWGNEASSDVYSPIDSIGIQRDFAALRLSAKQCITYFDDTVDDGLHNFMRWLLSPMLLDSNKAILHSSALVDSAQKSFVFLGPSGAGKTTVTSLGEDRLVLSDDMNLIDFSGDLGVFAGGVGGLYKPQVSIAQGFPLDTAYWIIQSSEHRIATVSKKKQMQYLLASFANLSWHSVNKDKSQEILESAELVLEKLEIKELYFKKDATFWDLL